MAAMDCDDSEPEKEQEEEGQEQQQEEEEEEEEEEECPFPFPIELHYREGAGQGLLATRDVARDEIILRNAPMAGVPLAKVGDTRLKSCSGCLTVSTDLEVCSACGVASHCAACRADPSGRAMAMHAHECHALKRLRAGEEGLALHFVSANQP